MILCVMCAYDAKAKAFLTPFYTTNQDVGLRSFYEAANLKDHQIYKYAEDFSLYYLGTFDDSTALMQLLPEPRFVQKAIQLKRADNHIGE